MNAPLPAIQHREFPHSHALHVAIAGALAEEGLTSLTLTPREGEERPLLARETDLPSVLASSPPGTIITVMGAAFRIELGAAATTLRWRSDDAAAASLAAAIAFPEALP